MTIPLIIAFETCTPEGIVREALTNVLPAAISHPPQRSRSLDATLDVSFNGGDRAFAAVDVGCSKAEKIGDVAEVAPANVEPQRMGIDPYLIGGMIIFDIIMLTQGIQFKREFEKNEALLNCYEKKLHAEFHAKISELFVGVESIRIGIFPIEENQYATCIIIDAPSRKSSWYISAFPPKIDDLKFSGSDFIKDFIEHSFFTENPLISWARGEYPRVTICPQNDRLYDWSTEYQKNQKRLNPPSGMTVREYAVRIGEAMMACNVKKYPLSAAEREKGPIWHSNHRLSTILEAAAGETAKNDIRQFLNELRMVSLISNIPEHESIVIPGLGEPLAEKETTWSRLKTRLRR